MEASRPENYFSFFVGESATASDFNLPEDNTTFCSERFGGAF